VSSYRAGHGQPGAEGAGHRIVHEPLDEDEVRGAAGADAVRAIDGAHPPDRSPQPLQAADLVRTSPSHEGLEFSPKRVLSG